jgi:hypothetical protein
MANDAQQAKAIQAQKNRDFMRLSTVQPIAANAQNGTTYANGQLMNFDVPIVAGAFVEKVRVHYNVSYTNTPGGTPGLAYTAAGPLALFNDVSVLFGNKQVTMHPYMTKILAQTRGYNRTPFGSVIGNNQAGIQNALYSQAAIASGANTMKGYFDVPLTMVHPSSPYGLIPIGSSGTRMQVQLQTATNMVGQDPLNYPLALTSLSATNVVSAVTGTVTVVIYYRDFKSFVTPQALECDLTGLPTAQAIRMRDINPISAGSLQFSSLTNPYPFVKIASIVIDGGSVTKFADAANIQAFRIDGAENTSSALRVYDQSTGGINQYYARNREIYGQDLDEGVLLFDANAENSTDASNQEGESWMNVSSSGFPASRLGFQLGTTSTALNIVPRVVTMGCIINPVGIN